MQNIIIDKPYRFIPPVESRFWPGVLNALLPSYVTKNFGVTRIEFRNLKRLQNSLKAGHGIVLAPNHCRPADPLVISLLSRELEQPFYIMASWHLFMQGKLSSWLLQRAGAFSIYREGMDKSALGAAIEILAEAQRPLVIFPEGIVSRTNDHLNPLMDGVTFIARNAAKKASKQETPRKVVLHAVALNYFFEGDIERAANGVLDDIDARLSWRTQRGMPLVERIYKTGEALLSLKETDYLGKPRSGDIPTRIRALIEHLLEPLEKEYRAGAREPYTIARVKRLRQSILPELTSSTISTTERERRWQQLADLYLAQQLDFYPPDYVRSKPTPERILETVERFEEDLTDKTRVHKPMSVVIEIGEPIEASPERERGKADPLLGALEISLKTLLAKNSRAI